MTETEMEKYLANKGYQINNREGCIDSIKVVDYAIKLGYKPFMDENTQTLKFTLIK
jgi:hypothetical protein